MKNLSIRFKITLWFTVALSVVVFFTCFVVLYADHQIIQKTIRDSLIETVENNVDEVEFYINFNHTDFKEIDEYIAFHNGYLEIDDDFLDQVNEVYTALYYEDGTLIYGENPISRNTSQLQFTDSSIQRITVKDTIFYIFDRKLTSEGLDGLWLRGVVSEYQGAVHMFSITRLALLFLPLLVLISSMGGYLLARRMLRPIQEISDSASMIRTGGDLKKRIEIGSGTDELHQLAESFNKMFQRLEEEFEAERQFTSDASHELRTPVSVILAQCEFSLEEQRSSEEYENALCTIQRQGRKMSRLINDMLDFTRLEMRAESYVKESIFMTELVETICFDMALIQEEDITLDYEVESNVYFNGNRQLLSRMLTNLISNAYRYGKEQGHIFVRLICTEGKMELSVTDDGIGIDPGEQDKIFRRFYQADPSHSGVGTGLGLSMVYEITQFHHGKIHVESEPGTGSKFTFLADCRDEFSNTL